MLYAQSTGGFYDAVIHGDNIPDDAVEITDEMHMALLEGQTQGKQIVAGDNGFPVLQDPPAPTDDQLAEVARIKRDGLLSQSDWVTLRRIDSGEPVPQAWLTYRQALRDIPLQAGFPNNILWPEVPA